MRVLFAGGGTAGHINPALAAAGYLRSKQPDAEILYVGNKGGMEERLGIRLLTRTTRSVSSTPAGERLLQAIGNRFDEIEAELDALTELRDKPAGTVRITCGRVSNGTTNSPMVRV